MLEMVRFHYISVHPSEKGQFLCLWNQVLMVYRVQVLKSSTAASSSGWLWFSKIMLATAIHKIITTLFHRYLASRLMMVNL